MKYLIPIVCSFLIAGCNNSSDTVAGSAAANNNEQTPVAAEAPAVASDTNAAEAPVASQTAETVPETKAPVPTAASSDVKPAVTEKKPQQTEIAAVDGSAVFNQKCVSCHGSKAEKSALGKSQVIAGWEEQKIIDALKGYQNGTYGKEMKMVMQGQAKGLNEAQLTAVAHYVSSL